MIEYLTDRRHSITHRYAHRERRNTAGTRRGFARHRRAGTGPPILFPMASGDSATFEATPGNGFGQGEVTLHCQDGALTITHKSCSPAGGGGQQ